VRDNTGKMPLEYVLDEGERKQLEWVYYCTTKEAKEEFARIEADNAERDAYMASIHAPDIMDAAFRGDIPKLQKFLTMYGDDLVLRRDKMGNTPLIAASATNQRDAFEFLLEAGAKITAKHPSGYDGLSFARGPKAYEELRFLAEAATIEYKAREHAKGLMQIAFDHARLRQELEERRRLEIKAAKELAEYLAMVARTQRAMSEDFAEDTILTCTDTAFVKFMVDEEVRLNAITTRLEEEALEMFTSTGDERLVSMRTKFRVEKVLKEAAKKRNEEEVVDETERCSMANALTTRIARAKLKEEETAHVSAERRVVRQYNMWVDGQKRKAMERDRLLKPRKAELTARLSKSVKQAM